MSDAHALHDDLSSLTPRMCLRRARAMRRRAKVDGEEEVWAEWERIFELAVAREVCTRVLCACLWLLVEICAHRRDVAHAFPGARGEGVGTLPRNGARFLFSRVALLGERPSQL